MAGNKQKNKKNKQANKQINQQDNRQEDKLKPLQDSVAEAKPDAVQPKEDKAAVEEKTTIKQDDAQNNQPKKKVNRFVLLTTDEADEELNRYQVRPWVLWFVIIVLCLLLGSVLGYISYEEKIWSAVDARSDEQVATIAALQADNARLEQEKLELETEIVGLNETVQILSETVSQKTQSESELKAQIEKQSIPTEFPLNGSASMKEDTIDDAPICVFDASLGSAVVATASGTVTSVKDDAKYVHSIWVDHGNGYTTIYRNAGQPRVQVGDSVVCGAALYIIEEKKEEMGYQMMKDGQYINPMDMLSING